MCSRIRDGAAAARTIACRPIRPQPLRIPLTFSVEDCRLIGRIIAECVAAVRAVVTNPFRHFQARLVNQPA